MRKRLVILPILLALAVSCSRGGDPVSNVPAARLARGFDNPPSDCRPLAWWHWMNGNVTGDGIRKDLEWMDRAGVGGVFLFDAGNFKKQIVAERLPYMSEGWQGALRLSLHLADSLGMFFGIASSPGWSITGGPWVSEDDAQKKLVWTETAVTGGTHVGIALPQPDSRVKNMIGEFDWYRDICVLAFPRPMDDTSRIRHADVKAGFVMDYRISDRFPTPETSDCIPRHQVLDISDCFDGNALSWDAPEGEWIVMRMGSALEGHVNGPATPESTGLEVDKLDRDAVRRYYDNYFGMFARAVDPSGDGSPVALRGKIDAVEIDSYESGRATWTERMEEEFRARRGYDLRPWMPVLTGRIIGSAALSERFLFDWRQTLGELIAENHYDAASDIFHPLGILRFNESHEERTAFVGDGMAVKRTADVPMCAFWVRFRAGWYSSYPTSEADVRESASVAHIYGQNICAAESFTTNGFPGKWDGFEAYMCHPGNLKRVGDAAMACGLNKFVIHTSVHQPLDSVVPGLSLDRYGQWFNRHDTWAEEARPWTDYLARSSYMLRAGKWCADIAYFYGEDKNITGRFMHDRPEIPAGWNYDFVNADVLLDEFSVRDGALVTGTGMSYRALRIDPEVRFMSLPVLEAIAGFARAGVQIFGPKPVGCADLASEFQQHDGHYALDSAYGPSASAAFASLADEIWSLPNVHADSFDMALTGLAPDVALAGSIKSVHPLPDSIKFVHPLPDSIKFVHRRLRGADIYWIANNSATPHEVDLSLRCTARCAEIWHPDTGLRESVPMTLCSCGKTTAGRQGGASSSSGKCRRGEAASRTGECRQGGADSRSGECRSVVHLSLTRDDAQFIILYSRPRAASLRRSGKAQPYVSVLTPRSEHRQSSNPKCCRGKHPRCGTAMCCDMHGANVTAVTGNWTVSFKSAARTPAGIAICADSCGTLPTLDRHPEPDVRFFSGTATYRTAVTWQPSTSHCGKEAKDGTCSGTGCRKRVVLDLGGVYNMVRVVINGQDLGLLWKEPFKVDVTDVLAEGRNEIELRVTNSWANRLIGDEVFPESRTTYTAIPFYDASSPLPPSGLSGPVRLIH